MKNSKNVIFGKFKKSSKFEFFLQKMCEFDQNLLVFTLFFIFFAFFEFFIFMVFKQKIIKMKNSKNVIF